VFKVNRLDQGRYPWVSKYLIAESSYLRANFWGFRPKFQPIQSIRRKT